MFKNDNELKRNGSGYIDPTAYEAIKNVEADSEERHAKCIHTIWHICELAGFKIENRIVLSDKKTGKVWW